MKPIIYQLLPRTFANYNETRKSNGTLQENGCGTLNAITPKALRAIRDLGATHVWYTGVIRHATAQYNTPSIVKGKAGSPYAITDYYDIDPDLCEDKRRRMQEFTELVERSHAANLRVIIDFVPNHVAREYHSTCKPKGVVDLGASDNPAWAFSPLNNFYYMHEPFAPSFDLQGYSESPARATGNDCFTARPSKDDWYETVKLNYGVFYQNGGEQQFDPIPNTWHKMLHILLFWAGKGIDGFRCDMAEMVPQAFWTWAIAQVKEQYPELLFIAEVYNPGEYRNYIWNGKFDYLYDKVGLYDTLKDVTCHGQSAAAITGCWQSLEGIQTNMLNFLENHDEDRIPSEYFASSPFKALSALFVSLFYNTAPFMIYAGQEFGVGPEKTSIFDFCSLEPLRRWNKGVKESDSQKYLHYEESDLYAIYKAFCDIAVNDPVICKGDTFDLQYANFENGNYNHHKQFSFLRHYEGTVYLCVANFEDHRVDVEINIPQHAFDYYGIQPDETLNPNERIKVSIEKNAGTILRIK